MNRRDWLPRCRLTFGSRDEFRNYATQKNCGEEHEKLIKNERRSKFGRPLLWTFNDDFHKHGDGSGESLTRVHVGKDG